MVMYQSKGFSFIEVILIVAISSVIVVIFIQNIAFSRKLLISNPQIIFYRNDPQLLSRGLKNYGDYLYADLASSIGKRSCSIKNPESLNNITTLEFADLQYGEVTSVIMVGNLLIAGLDSATSSNPDLIVIDKNTGQIISTLNTGPGVSGMTLQGQYIYLANTSVNSQFQVVNISNPESMKIVSSLKIPGSISSNSKFNPVVTSIATTVTEEENTRIFLGTQKSDLGEVFISDFNGNNLSFVRSITTGSIVNDLYTDDSGLWVTSPSDDELIHYNMDYLIDYVFNANGQSGNGKRIDMLSNGFKILGRTFGREELVQVDGPSKKIGGSINDLLINVRENNQLDVLVIATIGGNPVFQIWGTKDGMLDGLIKSIVLTAKGNRIVCDENSIVIGTASSTLSFIILKP